MLHRQYEGGVNLPKRFPREWIDEAVISISDSRKGPIAAVAHKTARMVQRQGRYDFCSFHPGLRSGTNAYLYVDVEKDKAVGYLAAYTGSHWCEIPDEASSDDVEIYEEAMLTVSVVFVCPEYRRRGIARKLAERCALDHGLFSPAELVWAWPFTDAGMNLAQSVCVGAAVRTGH